MSISIEAPRTVQELAERNLQAWQEHDLEAMLALYTPDAEFHLHGAGGVSSSAGSDEIRATYGFLLAAWPDSAYELKSRVVLDDLYIDHCVISGTLAMPWQMGEKIYEPKGQRVSFEVVDIMQCEGNRIKRKNSWIDGFAMRDQLERQA